MPTTTPDQPAGDALPNSVLSALVGLIFLVNAVILGYAIYVSRPAGVGGAATAADSAVAAAQESAVREVSGPMIPGLHHDHPLSTHQVGDVLIGELNCGACHEHVVTGIRPKQAPDLAEAAARIDPVFLQRFIADPGAVVPGTTMPNLLGGHAPQERQKIAADITAFLVDLASEPFRRAEIDTDAIAKGHGLFQTVGCVACHAPRDTAGREVDAEGAVTLAHVPAKYGLASLTEFLFQPLAVRPSGRMPDMTLTHEEAGAIAAWLLSTETAASAPPALRPGSADRGRQHFIDLDCVACHAIDGLPDARRAAAMVDLDLNAGCLGTGSTESPDFGLSAPQTRAIRAALSAPSGAAGNDVRVAMTLTTFNCIACHVREDYGGVTTARDRFFTTSEPSLGNEARIPPRLTGLGAKLRTEWLRSVLFDAATVRPYMHTRMPQVGEANLGELPALLARVDRVDPVDFPEFEGDAEREQRKAGQLLVGDQGLNCISCHRFADKDSPGFNGLDLLTSVERLNGDWFVHFLRSPGAHRPGITMPDFWAGGIAARTDILDGETSAQIHAIWHYLSLGRSARIPDGIHAVRSRLEVTDVARTYRGRSGIAGYRGIAVGFPAGMNYAFNAKTGTISGLWRGDYIRVNWSGQGAGGFNPASRAIELAQDVSFLRGRDFDDSADSPWPLRPVMTEENPIDPDPLYPRNHGYAFAGYYFDDAFVPTFMYRCGDVTIEDRSEPEVVDDRVVLVRRIEFSAPADGSVWFRALTGAIEPGAPGVFEIPGLRLHTPEGRSVLREFGVDGEQELLIEFSLPTGQSTVTIRYELLD